MARAMSHSVDNDQNGVLEWLRIQSFVKRRSYFAKESNSFF